MHLTNMDGSRTSVGPRGMRILYTLQRAAEAGAKAPFADVLRGAGSMPEDLDSLHARGLVGGRHVPKDGEPCDVENFLNWRNNYADVIVYLTTDGRAIVTSGPFRLLRAVVGNRGRRAEIRAVLAHVAAELSDAVRAARLGTLTMRLGRGGRILDGDEAARTLKLQASNPSESVRKQIARLTADEREELRQPLYLYVTDFGRTCIPG